MDLHLDHKHVLIGGGSKGIGLACAAEFLREGARVTLVSRNPEQLETAAKKLRGDSGGGRVSVQPADLSDAPSAARAADAAEQAFGPVDILVNSAGAARRTPFDELTPQAWAAAMQAKYFTVIHLLDPVIKRMGQRGGGTVVNIVGNGGKVASPTHLAGGAANAALMLASAGLAAAYGPKGVRVNAVNPGLTATERLKEGMAVDARMQGISMDEAVRRAEERLPLRRIATPEEIANAVVFLASDRASYINGAILAMDGALVPLI